MLANLIISSNNFMDNPKEVASMRTTHFAPNLEVFNYTDSKANTSDDEFLLTPNEKNRERQQSIEVQLFQKKPPPQKLSLEYVEYEAFEKQAAKKREEFFRRMTTKDDPAKFQMSETNVQKQITMSNVEEQIQKEDLMEIEGLPEPKSPTRNLQQKTQQYPSVKVEKVIEEEIIDSYKSVLEPLSQQNVEKINSLRKIREEKGVGQTEMQNDKKDKQKIEKVKQDRRRVTQDLKTLMSLGIFSQQEEKNQNKTEMNQKSVMVGEQNAQAKTQGFFQSRKRQSLINRAFQRLSGGKASRVKRDRITIDTKEIYNLLNAHEAEKQGWLSKIDQIKEEVQKSSIELEDKDKYKESLRRYIQQNNLRVKNINEKNNEIHQQNLNIQNYFRQQEGFITYLDQQIGKKMAEIQSVTDKAAKYQSRIDSTQTIKNLVAPLDFIQANYNTRIVHFQAVKNNSQIMTTFVLDFIVATNIYCRVKRLENHTPTIFIRPSTSSEFAPPEWTIDIKLRIELMSKYFKLKLQTLEPIEILLGLARYYEHLQFLQNDFQMIQKIYDLKQLTLCPSNQRLSFNLKVHYDTNIHITVNLLDFCQSSCYELQSTAELQRKRSSEENTTSFSNKGNMTLIEFISDALEKLIL